MADEDSDRDPVLVENDGPVGWIIFNRPDAGNAMDSLMLERLEEAWCKLDRDDTVRVIVNTGNGRAFQTGLDLVALSRDPASLREQSRRTKHAELRITALQNGVGETRRGGRQRNMRRGWASLRR